MGIRQLTAEAYARIQKQLLPPGRLWKLVASKLEAVFLAAGDEFVRVDARTADLIEESDPSTATELLPEWENMLGLPVVDPDTVQLTHALVNAAGEFAVGGDAGLSGQTATFEAWAKTDAAFGGSEMIFAQYGTAGNISFRFNLIDSDTIELIFSHNGTSLTIVRATIPDISTVWHHVAVTFDGTEAVALDRYVFYLDGEVVAGHSVISGTGTTIFDSATDIEIGSRTGGLDKFEGKLADLRMWKTKRTQQEIRKYYNRPVPPNENPDNPDRLSHWLMNDTLVAGAFIDNAESNNHATPDNTFAFDADDLPYDSQQWRRDLIVSRLVEQQRARPVDYQNALYQILGLAAPGDVEVIEITAAQAAAMGDLDGREVYRFYIFRDPADPGGYDVTEAQTEVDRIAQSHTSGHVIESDDFLCEDPFSLCERDILGA